MKFSIYISQKEELFFALSTKAYKMIKVVVLIYLYVFMVYPKSKFDLKSKIKSYGKRM